MEERLRREDSFIDYEKGTNPSFPGDSTFDVSLTERQVIARRALAYEVVMQNRDRILSEVSNLETRHR